MNGWTRAGDGRQARLVPPATPPALQGPPHPSPGTSRSFSPKACSWLAKLTNSSSQPPPPPGSGRFRRSLARARRAARSSRLRSASAFRLPLPGRLFTACFRDIALAPRPAAAEGKAAGSQIVDSGAEKEKRNGDEAQRRRRRHRAGTDAGHPDHVTKPRPLRTAGRSGAIERSLGGLEWHPSSFAPLFSLAVGGRYSR